MESTAEKIKEIENHISVCDDKISDIRKIKLNYIEQLKELKRRKRKRISQWIGRSCTLELTKQCAEIHHVRVVRFMRTYVQNKAAMRTFPVC